MTFTAGLKRPLKVTADGKDYSTHLISVSECLEDRQHALKEGAKDVRIYDGYGHDITSQCLHESVPFWSDPVMGTCPHCGRVGESCCERYIGKRFSYMEQLTGVVCRLVDSGTWNPDVERAAHEAWIAAWVAWRNSPEAAGEHPTKWHQTAWADKLAKTLDTADWLGLENVMKGKPELVDADSVAYGLTWDECAALIRYRDEAVQEVSKCKHHLELLVEFLEGTVQWGAAVGAVCEDLYLLGLTTREYGESLTLLGKEVARKLK